MKNDKRRSGPVRYALYNRCSSDDQAHKDFSTIDVQDSLNRQYITEKGGACVGAYKDEGKSGTNLNRPGWKQLLADAQAGKFDAVCVTYMSRLGRGDTFTVAEYMLREVGVRVEMVKEKFTDDVAGFVNQSMTRFVDGMYVEQVRQWTKTKMEAMVALGHFCGGTVPFGYRKENVSTGDRFGADGKPLPKRLVPNDVTASFVRRAYELFHETHCTTDVCTYLKAVTGQNWGYDRAKHLLTNETYRGVQRVGNWVNHTAHEPIISEALWDFVQAALQNKVRRPKRNPSDTTAYHLRGIVHCPACGCRMTPGDHHGRTAAVRYYECVGAHKKKTQGCPVRRVNARSLHRAVVDEVRRAAEHPTRMTELVREAVKALPASDDLQDELAALNRNLREKDRGIRHCLGFIEKGQGGAALVRRLEELGAVRQDLLDRRQQIERKIEETRLRRPDVDQVLALWGRFVRLWEVATDEEKNELLPLLVERVEMTDKEHGVVWLIFAAPIPDVDARKENPTSGNVGLTSLLGAGRSRSLNRRCCSLF